jgi:hypothetical protein
MRKAKPPARNLLPPRRPKGVSAVRKTQHQEPDRFAGWVQSLGASRLGARCNASLSAWLLASNLDAPAAARCSYLVCITSGGDADPGLYLVSYGQAHRLAGCCPGRYI